MRCVGADLALQRPAWGAILTWAEAEPTEWAYAGGFVDGEGCIAVTRSFVTRSNRFSYGVCVVVCNRDRSVLECTRSHRLELAKSDRPFGKALSHRGKTVVADQRSQS